MAYRFTDTGKWGDSWFYKLDNLQKLLFMYLCDNCDHAGLIEVNERRWAFDMNVSEKALKDALDALQKGLLYSTEGDIIFLRNFIKHQKNLPLNPKNKAHTGIISRLESVMHKFDYEDISCFFQAPAKPLDRGTGIGIGISIDNTNISSCDSSCEKTREKRVIDADEAMLNKISYSQEYAEAFLRWLRYKRKRKQAYKGEDSVQTAYDRLLKLANNSPDVATQIVDQSIGNGWAGLFEIKTQNTKTNGNRHREVSATPGDTRGSCTL